MVTQLGSEESEGKLFDLSIVEEGDNEEDSDTGDENSEVEEGVGDPVDSDAGIELQLPLGAGDKRVKKSAAASKAPYGKRKVKKSWPTASPR